MVSKDKQVEGIASPPQPEQPAASRQDVVENNAADFAAPGPGPLICRGCPCHSMKPAVAY